MLIKLMEWDGQPILADQKILKAHQVATLVEADQVLVDARRHAQELLEEAEFAAQMQRDIGRMEGEQEGREFVIAELAKTTFVHQAELRQNEVVVADAVLFFLERLLGHNPDVYAERVRQMVNESNCRDWMRIRIPAAQFNETQPILSAHLSGHPFRIDMQPDDHLAPGSAIMETESGVVDAKLDVVLRGIKHAIVQALQVDTMRDAPIAAGSLP